MIQFDWNPTKASSNQKKHGVTFEEATSVFFDEYATQFFDDKHSQEEDRFIMLGMSIKARVLIVCHCERGEGETIRIISARRATARERTYYEGQLL
jgi:uncharacterized DUF497 family protein